jgi:hypothetical protein
MAGSHAQGCEESSLPVVAYFWAGAGADDPVEEVGVAAEVGEAGAGWEPSVAATTGWAGSPSGLVVGPTQPYTIPEVMVSSCTMAFESTRSAAAGASWPRWPSSGSLRPEPGFRRGDAHRDRHEGIRD